MNKKLLVKSLVLALVMSPIVSHAVTATNYEVRIPTGAPSIAMAPNVPLNLQASPLGEQINVSWDVSVEGTSGISGYTVFVSTDPNVQGTPYNVGNQLSYSFTGASSGQTYYFRVQALSSDGDSGVSSAISSAFSLPSEVSSISTSFSGSNIALSWATPSAGTSAITGYKIYRGTSSGSQSLYTAVGNQNGYTVPSSTIGVTYYFKVSAVTDAGEGLLSSVVSKQLVLSKAPSSRTATASGTTINYSWSGTNAGSHAITGYKLYKSTSSGVYTYLTTVSTSSTSGSYAYTGLSAGNTYYIAVQPVTALGDGSKTGLQAKTMAVTVGGSAGGGYYVGNQNINGTTEKVIFGTSNYSNSLINAQNYCNAGSFNGYTDWSLASLTTYTQAKNSGMPATLSTTLWHWTNNYVSSSEGKLWRWAGHTANVGKTSSYRFRCQRYL